MPPVAIESAAPNIEHLAARAVPGSGPVDVEPLGSGLMNRSYRVRRDGRLFSLRIASPRAAELGLDQAWECRVLRCAADAGLAPAIEWCEPSAGILVMRWVRGRSWSIGQAAAPENIETVARLARRVHALPLLEEPRIVSPAQWTAFYRAALTRRDGESLQPRAPDRQRLGLDSDAQALLAALGAYPSAAPALCHSDLHVQNLVISSAGVPLILDWEYAHVSEAFWDLAGWVSNSDLAAERRDMLLRCYLAREPTSAEAVRLRRLVWLYDYACLLWSELYLSSPSDGVAAADGVAARARQLAERLRREP